MTSAIAIRIQVNRPPIVAPELTADWTAPSGLADGCCGVFVAGWSFCDFVASR